MAGRWDGTQMISRRTISVVEPRSLCAQCCILGARRVPPDPRACSSYRVRRCHSASRHCCPAGSPSRLRLDAMRSLPCAAVALPCEGAFGGPPVLSAVAGRCAPCRPSGSPPPGWLPSQHWLRVAGLSAFHARSTYKGHAPYRQRDHAGRTQQRAPHAVPCAANAGR